MIADLAQDVRYGFRSLLRNPIFSLVAALTILSESARTWWSSHSWNVFC